MSLQALGLYRESAALSCGKAPPAGDIADLVRWAGTCGRQGAAVPFPGDRDAFAEAAALVLGFHYINRMANIFLPASVLPVPGRFPRLQALSKRMAAWMVRPLALQRREEGLGVELLPAAEG